MHYDSFLRIGHLHGRHGHLLNLTLRTVGSLEKRIADAEKNAAERAELDDAISKWGKSVFRQFDTDKNGALTNKELARALKALPPAPQQQSIDQMVASMDANSDGCVQRLTP